MSYLTDIEIGWIAWGVGGLAGYGMSLGLQGEGDKTSGVVAALIALLSVFGGKYAAVHLVVHQSLAEVAATPVGELDMLVYLSDGVVEEWTAEGRSLDWPLGMTIEQAGRSRGTQQRDPGRRSEHRQEGFVDSLGPYDLVWAGLAIATAFRLGSRSKTAEASAPAA